MKRTTVPSMDEFVEEYAQRADLILRGVRARQPELVEPLVLRTMIGSEQWECWCEQQRIESAHDSELHDEARRLVKLAIGRLHIGQQEKLLRKMSTDDGERPGEAPSFFAVDCQFEGDAWTLTVRAFACNTSAVLAEVSGSINQPAQQAA